MVPRTPGALKVRRRIADAGADASGHNTRMDILLNGEPLPLAETTTLGELLESQHLAQRRVAVEINGEIVPRSRHGEHVLHAGDQVEIVHALGGG